MQSVYPGWDDPVTLGGMTRALPASCRELIQSQQGVLSRAQALESGLGSDTVRWRLRAGDWRRLYRGVYVTFTGEPGREAALWAALRRAGPAAVLSHQTAAELGQLVSRPSPLIHVTVPRQHHLHEISGLVIHRSSRVEAARHPTLMPPRTRIEETTLDLAGTAADLDDAFGWLARACGGRMTTPDLLRAALDQRARMRWRAELAAALADIADGAHSVLELRYVRRVERAHRLPPAQRQVRITRGGRTEYRDALYAEFGVAVETDGEVAHPLQSRWRDQHRDNAAQAEGIVTLRYSWSDVTRRPCAVAAEVAATLQQRGWRATPRPCTPACPVISISAVRRVCSGTHNAPR
jgi:predicted transcriptional regulator of viral defense system/very-short-patch-repair endonuclease